MSLTDEDLDLVRAIAASLGAPTQPVGVGEEAKMVLVVRQDLHMGLGKTCSQCCHACLALYRDISRTRSAALAATFAQWELQGETKVVLRARDLAELLDLQQRASSLVSASSSSSSPTTATAVVHSVLIHDAGRTQIEPGSATVLGLFGTRSAVDSITGTLKLL